MTTNISNLKVFYFYPRSPCGERRSFFKRLFGIHEEFLSTLSLRRATRSSRFLRDLAMDFYPRSPCGERPYSQHVTRPSGYFYPRSPCGERPKAAAASACFATFLSTLSLRRATQTQGLKIPALCISIHALLAESDPKRFRDALKHLHFYPRSPCGERHSIMFVNLRVVDISIHALLAESDGLFSSVYLGYMKNFYPRSPCGERPLELEPVPNFRFISIHALLAESDKNLLKLEDNEAYFYPRSPCGERRVQADS